MVLTVKVEEWLAIRKREPSRLIPRLPRLRGVTLKPWIPTKSIPTFPKEYQCVGRKSSVRRPGNDIWVWFGDLPNETLKRLREKHRWL